MLGKVKAKLLFKLSGIIIGAFFLLVIGLWLALPTYLNDYVESNDKTWCHRDITIEKTSFNPFTFTFNLINVKIHEPNSKTIFVSLDHVLVNLEFLPLLKSKLSIEEITIKHFYGNIVQNGDVFNFSDLFNSKTDSKTEPDSPLEFKLENISVLTSKLKYTDLQIGSEIVLDSITILDKAFTSNDTDFDAEIAFKQPKGGQVSGTFFYNLKTNDYKIETQIKSWQLGAFDDYVASVIRLSKFEGQLNAELKIAGNVANNYIASSGEVSVDDFIVIDPENKPLLNVGKFLVDINEIDNKSNVYDFENILIKDSNVRFEYLTNGDNFTKWLVNEDTSVAGHTDINYYVSPFEMLSVYIYDMTKAYIFKSYEAGEIQLSNFNLKFYDYTLEDPFHMDLEHVSIIAKDIKPDNQYANFNIAGKINATGVLDGAISVSRQGIENMEVDMTVTGLFLNRFSPYGRFYTAHHLMEGIASFTNKSSIKNSYLTSENTLHVEQIKVSKKDKTRSGYSLPMRLAVALMKDTKGNIDLEIPIKGPINDPEYKFGKIVWQVVKNIFTKAVTSPVRALTNALKLDASDLDNIYFDNGQIGLSPKQKKTLDGIASILSKKPDFNIAFNHLYNIEYEKDALALKNVKLMYLKQSHLPIDSNVPIGKQAFDLPSTDPKFLEFLKIKTLDFDDTISVPENARRLLGIETLTKDLDAVNAKQKQLIKTYLIVEKKLDENRFKIIDGSNTKAAINQTQPKFEVKFSLVE